MDGQQLVGIAAPVIAAIAAIVAIAYNTRRLSKMTEDGQEKKVREIITTERKLNTGKFFDRERGTKIEVQVERLQETQDSGFHDMRTRLDDLRDMMNGGTK